jgi:acetyltransferase
MLQQLPQGMELSVRPIRPDDKHGLELGLESLSEQSRYQRFLSPKPSFTAAELRYLTEVNGHDHVALVVERPGREGELIAVGRWVRLIDDPTTAEIAITVADPYQGRGIGSLLARLLADEARLHGIRRFTATIAGNNEPALRLMRTASDHLERRGNGAVVEMDVDLAA